MRKEFKSAGAIVFLLFFAVVTISAQYYPGKVWEEKQPGELSVSVDGIERAVEFAQNNEYSGSYDMRRAVLEGFAAEPYHEVAGPTRRRGGPAGIIIKNGYIIAKWGDIERVDMTHSVTKSYLSTIAGLAIDDGLISNVEDKVGQYVWEGRHYESEHNAKITWAHMLTQSSDWSGDLFGMQDWADRPPREGGIDDWKNRKLLEPGTNFEYNDVRVNLLAYSLLHVWRKPLPQVLKERIMDPIGASTTWRWFGYENSWVNVDGVKVQSVSGGGHSGGGIFISALDHARFGLLFLRNGKWEGEQLISSEWVKAVQQSSEANVGYGYMWWLNKGNRKWDNDLSENVFQASGFGGNYIVVDQEHDLVVVTRWLEPSTLGEFMGLVADALQN